MACVSCNQRKARRACPALGQTICSVCCGTKRLTEINCPGDCVYLASAREHPAAVVRKQWERDVAVLLPSIRHLTERQHQLFYLFHGVIARYIPEGFSRLHDEDVAEACASVAATFETAARGVIYEHAPPSPIAHGLARAMMAMVEQLRTHGTRVYDGEAAIALRAIEEGALNTHKTLGSGDPTAYLTLVRRLLPADPASGAQAGADPAPAQGRSIILP